MLCEATPGVGKDIKNRDFHVGRGRAQKKKVKVMTEGLEYMTEGKVDR